jgi:F-type H+-transporting ATPase subunit c
MDPQAAHMLGKLIGAGIACVGMGGAGIGVGVIFGQYLSGALRNPAAAASQNKNNHIGYALTEALAIFTLQIALKQLFVV